MSHTLDSTSVASALCTGPVGKHCPSCGADRPQGPRVVSYHTTSSGILVWLRCPCGALQACIVGLDGYRRVTYGRP